MKNSTRLATGITAALCLSFALSSRAQAPAAPPASGAAQKETPVTTRASGTFDVKMTPQPAEEGAFVGRMAIDKQFHGDLDGTSKGEMLAFMTEVQGSAGYVAMERVSGTLKGKSGTFVLQHSGLMNRGEPQLVITVVPDSGTGQLAGLAGTMKIIIEGGKHSYEFDYTLPASP